MTSGNTVTRSVTEQYVVQHRLTANSDGWPEAQPHATPDAAFTEMDAHAHYYEPGNIRVVRKVTTVTVEVEVTELLREGARG
jgi:hypothetical protein